MTEAIEQILPIIQDHEIFKKHDFRLVGGTALSYHTITAYPKIWIFVSHKNFR